MTQIYSKNSKWSFGGQNFAHWFHFALAVVFISAVGALKTEIAQAANQTVSLRQYPVMTCKATLPGESSRKLLRVFANRERFTWVQMGGISYQVSRIEKTRSSSGDLAYIMTARQGGRFLRLIGKKSFTLMQAPMRIGVRTKKNAEVVTTSASLLCRNELY